MRRLAQALFASDLATPTSWTALFGETIHLRIGSRPPVLGIPKATGEMEAFLDRVQTLGRGYAEMWFPRGALIAETELAWLRAGRELRKCPCAFILRASQGKLIDLRFYLESEPLFRSTTAVLGGRMVN